MKIDATATIACASNDATATRELGSAYEAVLQAAFVFRDRAHGFLPVQLLLAQFFHGVHELLQILIGHARTEPQVGERFRLTEKALLHGIDARRDPVIERLLESLQGSCHGLFHLCAKSLAKMVHARRDDSVDRGGKSGCEFLEAFLAQPDLGGCQPLAFRGAAAQQFQLFCMRCKGQS
jgi:hypothetical protein